MISRCRRPVSPFLLAKVLSSDKSCTNEAYRLPELHAITHMNKSKVFGSRPGFVRSISDISFTHPKKNKTQPGACGGDYS